jgi:hypothetical protein
MGRKLGQPLRQAKDTACKGLLLQLLALPLNHRSGACMALLRSGQQVAQHLELIHLLCCKVLIHRDDELGMGGTGPRHWQLVMLAVAPQGGGVQLGQIYACVGLLCGWRHMRGGVLQRPRLTLSMLSMKRGFLLEVGRQRRAHAEAGGGALWGLPIVLRPFSRFHCNGAQRLPGIKGLKGSPRVGLTLFLLLLILIGKVLQWEKGNA